MAGEKKKLMIQTDAFCIRSLQDNRRDGRSCTSYWYMFFKLGIAGHTVGEKIRPNRAWQFITPTTWFWALCAPCLLVDLAKKSGHGASGSSRRAKEHVNLDYKITKRDKTLGAFP
jgi:hypothetical protein